jgi:hypothetical protein
MYIIKNRKCICKCEILTLFMVNNGYKNVIV